MEEYRCISKLSIDDLCVVAKKSGLSYEIQRKIKMKKNEYHKYDKRTSINELEKSLIFMIDGKEISLDGKIYEMKEVKEYLYNQRIYNCDYTFKKYFKLYLEGNLDLSKTIKENIHELKEKERSKKLELIMKKINNKNN